MSQRDGHDHIYCHIDTNTAMYTITEAVTVT